MVSDGASVEPIKVPHTIRMVENGLQPEFIRCADGVFRLRDMLRCPERQGRPSVRPQRAEFRPPRAAALAPERC